MRKIKSYLVKNIPANLYKKLYSLNYRDMGCMRDCLTYSKKEPNKDDFVVTYMDDEKVLGWCLVHNSFINDKDKVLQIYVRRSMRGKGIGTKIIKKAKTVIKKKFRMTPKVYFDHADGFFAMNGFTRKL
jgi:GNAT superfamily N-acetyltransferase